MEKLFLHQFTTSSLTYLLNEKTIVYKGIKLKTDYIINIVNEFILKYLFTNETTFNIWSIILKQKYGKHYNYYISWLLENNIIYLVSDYYSGKKARTYRLNVKDIKITRCKIYDKIIVNKTKRQALNRTFIQYSNSPIDKKIREILVDDLKYIELDSKKAIEYINNEYNLGKIDKTKYYKNLSSIENIKYNYIFFKFDPYGRMHTNFTTLKKEIKTNYITIDNYRISEVDIKNSQPLFFSKLLETELEEKNINSEIKRFIELSKLGIIYDDFIEKIKNIDRNETKIIFYKVFFGKNTNKRKVDNIFKKVYPSVYEYIQEFKSLDSSYKSFSHLLQKMESEFIFNIVIKKLKELYPHIHVFTVHDSICFPEKYKIEVNLVFNNCKKNYFNI